MFQSLQSCSTTVIGGKTITEIASIKCVPIIFNNVVNAFLIFSGVVALFLIAYSAIRLIMSGGDQKQIGSARQMMTYAIIGLIWVLMAFAIVFGIAYLTRSTGCITDLNNFLTGCK